MVFQKKTLILFRKRIATKSVCAFVKERMFRIHLDEPIETIITARLYQNIIQQNGLGSKQFIMDN